MGLRIEEQGSEHREVTPTLANLGIASEEWSSVGETHANKETNTSAS